jgi:energy-coupling factor transport system ATP-binding protein
LSNLALEVDGLWFWYDERTPVLRGVNLVVPQGQFLALVGANGSGKTTLVKHFNGLLRPGRGQVRVGGQDAAGRSIGELARRVGFLFQHPEHQIFSPTVYQELAFGPENLGLSPDAVESHVEAALARFDLSGVADQPPAILSYGLRRRVTLASLAAADPSVLVLDEPTVGLDASGRQQTLNWLAELHAAGRTIILVTHDMTLVGEYAERLVVLRNGQVLADGKPQEIFQWTDLLGKASLVQPPVVALAQALQSHELLRGCLTPEAFCAAFCALVEDRA